MASHGCCFFVAAVLIHILFVNSSELNRLYENRVFGINQLRLFDGEQDVVFYHFSSRDPSEAPGRLVRLNNLTELEQSGFDASKPTRFFVHGWYGNFRSRFNVQLRDAYRRHPDEFNLVIVDWGRLSHFLNYFKVFYYVQPVGRILAKYLDFVNEHAAMPFASVTLIGHSLGAHVVGSGAKNAVRGRVQNIVGLDPALPFFMMTTNKLQPSDAVYVETIHTNLGFKGYSKPLGTAAFYPNWGKRQVGCGWDLFRSCSHHRVILYFAESVANRGSLVGVKCANWNEILDERCTAEGSAALGGEPLNGHLKEGVYYVRTNGNAPFGTYLE